MSTSVKNLVSIYLKLLSIFVIYLILSLLPVNAEGLVLVNTIKNTVNKNKPLMAIGGETIHIINRRPFDFKDVVNIEAIEINEQLLTRDNNYIVIEDKIQ